MYLGLNKTSNIIINTRDDGQSVTVDAVARRNRSRHHCSYYTPSTTPATSSCLSHKAGIMSGEAHTSEMCGANVNRHVPAVDSRHCSYVPQRGNQVLPLVDGEKAFQRLAASIGSATTSLWCVIGFLEVECELPWPWPTASRRQGTLFDILAECVNRGLDVRVLFWGASKTHFSSVFSGDSEDRALSVVLAGK